MSLRKGLNLRRGSRGRVALALIALLALVLIGWGVKACGTAHGATAPVSQPAASGTQFGARLAANAAMPSWPSALANRSADSRVISANPA